MRRTSGWRQGALFSYHRNVYLMLLFTLGKGLQLSIATLTTNLYLYSLGYRQEFIGLITAIPAIGAFLAAVPIGLIADRWGRKPLLIWSGLLNPLALVGIALSSNAPLLIAASLANGLLSGGYWVTNLPLLTESTSDDQRVGVLALNSFLLLGVGAVGSLIGGLVPELVAHLLHISASSVVPLRFGVLASAIVVFLPAIPLFWLADSADANATRAPAPAMAPAAVPAAVLPASEALVVGQATAEQSEHAAPNDPTDPVGRRATAVLFLKLLLPDVLFTTGTGAVVGLLQLYLKLRFHLDPGPLGVLLTIAGLTGGATSLLAPRLVRRWGSLRTSVLMQYLTVPAVLVTGFAPGVVVAAGGEFARNVLRGFFDPVYSAFAMQSVSRR
ncbi:MAG TPA: MFS transporter, partial [Ktedonobacterales bacterium]|nr:MFS transporter [Ktedonobacterales bacterium]